MKRLGEFELAVLSSVIELDEGAYGVPIRQALCDEFGRDVAIGAVYTTLSRLEKKNYVVSEQGEPTAERGGRAKRYYKITSKGREAMDATLTAMRNLMARMA